jgi:hypothetical protein
MKNCISIIILLLSFHANSFCIDNDTISKSREQTLKEISYLRDEVKEIRRDQLNYLIEKDLLKETYSTSYQTINIVITIILGIFVILGYLGIRDINTIKEGYEKKLSELANTQKNLEVKLTEFNQTKEKSEEKLTSILSQNDEQNKKIKVLELREKIGNLISKKLYTNAIEYVGVGLDMMPNDIELLRYKGFANFKLLKYSEAINALEKILTFEKSDSNAMMDLAELYLLTGDMLKFRDIFSNNQSLFHSEDNKINSFYLEALSYYKQKDEKKLVESIQRFFPNFANEEEKKKISSWDFRDSKNNIKDDEESKLKILITSLIDLLEGVKNVREIKSVL